MSITEVILSALWLVLAAATAANWRAQIRWHKYYMDRLGPEGVTKSPIASKEDPNVQPSRTH